VSRSRTQPSPSRQTLESIPLHTHGISRYYYDLGCNHHLCKAKAAACQAGVRTRRRARRVRINGLLVSPDLAPVGSDVPARHGTVYGRRGFGCKCLDCRSAVNLPHLPARLKTIPLESSSVRNS
jgi:hypothetical protein